MSWDEIATEVVRTLSSVIDQETLPATEKLDAVFGIVAAYRSARLTPDFIEQHGSWVLAGPFAGMRYMRQIAEGALLPKLIGSYEAELHPSIGRIVETEYDRVINIGCAEGYYAVGLAREMPAVQIDAFDIDEHAQDLCRELAGINDVESCVTVGGRFEPEDFASYADGRTVVLCDIEGAEAALLDPERAPELAHADILAECHQVDGEWTSDLLLPRFRSTHRVTEIDQQPRDFSQYPALEGLSDTDCFFALLERLEPARWLFLEAKSSD
ncbi:MAG: class I SAM-dependent methyltransferase [Pseudomonadota bacterium]